MEEGKLLAISFYAMAGLLPYRCIAGRIGQVRPLVCCRHLIQGRGQVLALAGAGLVARRGWQLSQDFCLHQ